MLSGGISARTARLNGTSSMAIRGDAQILSDESGRRSGAREVAGEARPGQRKSSQASAQRRRAGSLEPSNSDDHLRGADRWSGRALRRTSRASAVQWRFAKNVWRKGTNLGGGALKGVTTIVRKSYPGGRCYLFGELSPNSPARKLRSGAGRWADADWLRGQVTPPFAERRQTKRDQSRLAPGDACALMRTESSPTSRPERAVE